MNKKSLPYIIGIPNMAVGLLWAMNMALIPMFVGTITTNNAKLGSLISMAPFTGIFVQYLVGLISDRSNFKMGKRKPFMIMGIIATTIFTFLIPFSKTYAVVFILSFAFYFALNFFQGPYYSLIPEIVDNNQLGLANGFSKVISVVGSAVIFVAGPILWKVNHAAPFFFAGLIGIIVVGSALIFIKEKKVDVYEKPAKLSFDFIKFPSVTKLYAVIFFIFFSYGCITPYFVKYCTNYLKIDTGAANTALLVLTLSGALFAYPIGVLSDKIERRKVFLLGVVIFAVCLSIAVFVKTTLGLYAVLAVIGIGFIAVQITAYTIMAEIVPNARLGEFMGLLNLFISLGQFLANNIMGKILDIYGFTYFFPISAASMIIAAILLCFSKFEKYDNAK